MLKQDPKDEIAWLLDGQTDRALAIEGRSNTASARVLSFYAPDFALLDTEPWLIGRPCGFTKNEQVPLPHLQMKVEPSSAEFARMFEEIQARIQAKEFEKVVPMVSEDFEFAGDLHHSHFSVNAGPHQFAYGFEFGGEGLCGVTPELLFEVDGECLRTMALAGTGKADGPSLLTDKKERHEHQLVIEHIAQELKKFGPVEVGETTERVYGLLKHLFTPIELKLSKQPRFEELVATLHPTAALGGWPRKPAVEWLEEQK